MTRTEMRPEVRERLLAEMLRELGEKGREGISVAAILARLGIPAEEFAAEFGDLDACLDSAYDELTARITAAVRSGCVADPVAGEAPWPDRVRRALDALLTLLAANPVSTRTLIRVYPAVSDASRARYQSFLDQFAVLLAPGREFSGIAEELPDGVEALAVGAVEAILFEEVISGRTGALPALLPSLLFSVLVPFLGPVAAATEMEKAERDR